MICPIRYYIHIILSRLVVLLYVMIDVIYQTYIRDTYTSVMLWRRIRTREMNYPSIYHSLLSSSTAEY